MARAPKPTTGSGSGDDGGLEDIARAVAEQLPGWQLARKQPVADAATGRSIRNATPGVTLKELRRKFLPGDEVSDAVEGGVLSEPAPGSARKSVLVEPKDGGPAKVADIVGGKVKLVQG